MTLTNPADPYGVEAQLLAILPSGGRLESYSTRFLRVVVEGTPKDEPAGVYNSLVRPISEYMDIPKIRKWQQKMNALEASHQKKTKRMMRKKTYGKIFAGK